MIASAIQPVRPKDEIPIPEFLTKVSARDLALGALDLTIMACWWEIGLEDFRRLAYLIRYADHHPGRRKRRAMDIDKMVGLWTEVIVDLSTAHDHARRTAADERTDELLGPLLAAPVTQIREFAQKLATRLREDERVPFLVWSSYQRIIEPLILKGPDGPVIELKKRLATEIAEQVEQGLDRAELVAAIAGALQWRHLETLGRVKEKLEQGEKPRLKGRESCLFLEAGGETVVL